MMFKENLKRLSEPKMEYYREVYKGSKRWNGLKSLNGKKVIVYAEQGHGDAIQFMRYLPVLKAHNCHVYFHCMPELHRLAMRVKGVDEIIDRNDPNIPSHDFHIPSLSLPFVLGSAEAKEGYIDVSETIELPPSPLKIGVAWEGNPSHSDNLIRCCPAAIFSNLHSLPGVNLYSLQREIHRKELLEGAGHISLMGVSLNDYFDTACLINSLDVIVTVDTSVLHLAGAMPSQKPTFALLSHLHDHRWDVKRWYRNVSLCKQHFPGDWSSAIHKAETAIRGLIF